MQISIFQSLQAGLAAVLLGAATLTVAQDYPSRPIQLTVPFPPGAPVDSLARSFGLAFEKQMGQSVVVMNRDGAGTTVAFNAVNAAPADGYSIIYGPGTAITVHTQWMKGLQYKADSFVPVCQTFENVFVLAGGPNSPLKDFAAMLALAKSKPGGVSYAHPGISTSPHLTGAELFQRAGVPATDIPFRGESAMVGQLREGAIDVAVVTTAFAVNQGLKPFVVFSNNRLANFPDTPTAREVGFPIAPSSFGGLFMRADTPKPIVAKVERACKAATADAEFRETARRLFQQTEYLDSAQFAARVQADSKSKAVLLKTVKLDR